MSGACQAFEVIVVDNGSIDETVAIAKSYSPWMDIRVLVVPGVNVGALRNAGAELAAGAFLAFLDADCFVERSWFEHAVRVLRSYPSTIVGSSYALPEDAGWPARVWHRRFHEGRTGEVSYVPGGNLMIPGELFRRIGGFDAALRSNEDSEFCSRARRMGIRVFSFPELAVIHLGAEKSLCHFVRRQLWHGSDVCSRSALAGNIRAIGFAAYTLFCGAWLLTVALFQPVTFLCFPALALLLPTVVMSANGRHCVKGFRNFAATAALLLTYGIVRACVLPVAAVRGLRSWVSI